jgi:chromosome segregation ATPase
MTKPTDQPRNISREWDEIHAERDALRAEIEKLRAIKAGVVRVELANRLFGSDKYVPEQALDALRAEVERLLIPCTDLEPHDAFCSGGPRCVKAMREEVKEQYADHVERLRTALEEITDLELEGDASLADAMTIADEALNPPPDASQS